MGSADTRAISTIFLIAVTILSTNYSEWHCGVIWPGLKSNAPAHSFSENILPPVTNSVSKAKNISSHTKKTVMRVQNWVRVKSPKKIPDPLRFWWKLINLKYPMTETCTHNFSPGWPLGLDLEVIIGHDFFRTLRQLNGHIFCSEALRRLQQAPKCSELSKHWQISHK